MNSPVLRVYGHGLKTLIWTQMLFHGRAYGPFSSL